MTQIWTEKHSAFCTRHSINNRGVYLLQWLTFTRSEPELTGKSLIDLREFNKFVEEARGKGLDKRTVLHSLSRLENAGAIPVEPSTTWFLKRITVLEVSE